MLGAPSLLGVVGHQHRGAIAQCGPQVGDQSGGCLFVQLRRRLVDQNDVAYVTDYSPDSSVPENYRGPAGTGRGAAAPAASRGAAA